MTPESSGALTQICHSALRTDSSNDGRDLRNRLPRGLRLVTAVLGLVICIPSLSQQTKDQALFNNRAFKEVNLNGIKVRLGDPVEVTSQMGWRVVWSKFDRWTFVHLTPILAKFPNGDLLATYTLDPDTQQNPQFSSAFQISHDGGLHWGTRYGVLMQHIPMIFIPEPNNSLMALPSEIMPLTSGDKHNFRGPLLTFEDGGRRMVMDTEGFRVLDWPKPVDVIQSQQPKGNWHSNIYFTGSYIKVGTELLATVYWHAHGETKLQLSLASSIDGGHTWHYYSTVATADDAHLDDEQAPRPAEGPDESSMIRLADGRLMIVFRVGELKPWHLRRSYSSDNGRTWTEPQVLPAYSVEPQLVRLANGAIALTTGRPGLHLWLTTDPKAAADSWQDVDIAAQHNLWCSDPSCKIVPRDPSNPDKGWTTTAYTGLVQVAPNKLLLLYDRGPEGAPTDSQDLTRLFIMPIEVLR